MLEKIKPFKPQTKVSLKEFLANYQGYFESFNWLNQESPLDLFYRYVEDLSSCDLWAHRKSSLLLEIKKYLKQSMQEDFKNLEFQKIERILQHQLITLDSSRDLLKLVSRHFKSRENKYSQVKLKLFEKGVLALLLNGRGELESQVYGLKVSVHGGKLNLLKPESHLHYNSYLELDFNKTHKIYNGSYYYYFKNNYRGIKGFGLYDSNLQPTEKFQCDIDENLPFFYQLKKIEVQFLDKASDPYYKKICNGLLNAIDNFDSSSPESLQSAKNAIKSGYLLLKNTINDDIYLQNLLLRLDRMIQAEMKCLTKPQPQENLPSD